MSENITPLTTGHLGILRDDIAQFRAGISKELDDGFSDVCERLTHVAHGIRSLKRGAAATPAAQHSELHHGKED